MDHIRRSHVNNEFADHTLKSALTHLIMEFGEQSEWLRGRVRQIKYVFRRDFRCKSVLRRRGTLMGNW